MARRANHVDTERDLESAGASSKVSGDEYIARIAEMLTDEKGNIKESTTWEKVKGAVRDFFRDVLGLELTDADIRYMLWRSGERLRRNKADAFTHAQDVVTGQSLQGDATLSHSSPVRFAIGKKRTTDFTKRELDKAYFDALERKDMAYARQLVDEAARRAGYTDTESDYQGRGTWTAPGNQGYTDEERRANLEADTTDINVEDIAKGFNLVDESVFYNPRVWGGKQDAHEAIIAIRQAIYALKSGRKPTITIYRAVPTAANDEELSSKKVRENYVRNGDWVTPSKSYAIGHGEHRFGKGRYRIIEQEVEPRHLWWDGNDIREWGFDDGNEYRYQNTRNNRKLNDIVTYDYDGNIIPLSKRFNKREYDTRFSIGEPYDVKENPVGRAEPGLNGKTVTVVSVPRHNFKGTGKEALQTAGSWATDNLVGEYSNEETGGKGVMYVSGNAISKFLSKAAVHKSDSLGAHLAVLKKFKDVLRESTDCESHPDFKKGKNGERRPENGIASKNIIHRLYGAVVIDGKTYRVKTTVKEQTATRKRNAPYTYEVTEIELLDGSMAGIVNDGSQLLSDAPSNSIPLAKLLKNVRMSYAEAGKEANFLLDESRRRDEKEIEQTTVAETVNAVAAELQDKFGVEVEVVDSLDGVQNEQERKAEAEGQDNQGNPLNADGSLKVEAVSSVDEITDEDFTAPMRNVQLPELPENVAAAIGTDGKPVVIKKNILKRNTERHPDVSPTQSREILKTALYTPNLYGQNQRVSHPYNWVLISVKGKDGRNKLVLLEVNHNKDFAEIVHWHFVEDRAIEKIKKQAEREGGQLLILPSIDTEEAGALSGRPSGSASESKGSELFSTRQETVGLKTIEPTHFDIDFDGKVTTTNDEAFADADDKANDILGKFGFFGRRIEEDAKIRDANTQRDQKYDDIQRRLRLTTARALYGDKPFGEYSDEEIRMVNSVVRALDEDDPISAADSKYHNPDITTAVKKAIEEGKAAEAEYNQKVAAAHKSAKEYQEFIERHFPPVIEFYRARQEYFDLKEILESEERRVGGDEWTEEEEKSYNEAWDEFESYLEKLDAAYLNFAEWANSPNRQEEIATLEKDFARLKENDTRFSIGEPYDSKAYPTGRVEPGLSKKYVTVVDVPRHQHEGTLKDALGNAKQWAKENIVGTLTSEETGGKGLIEISGNAVEKFLSNSALEKSSNIGVHISALHKLPEIIRESIFVESHPDFKKVDGKRRPENGIASNDIIHRLYGAITINGNVYRVKTTLKELSTEKGRNITHSYEVTKVELIDVSSATSQERSGQLLKRPINSISAAKLLKNVRMSYAEAGKEANFLLDESRRRDEKEIEQPTVSETVNAVAAELQDKFGVGVEVVESLDGVQNEQARKALAAGKVIKGWYEPSTGKVVLYAPNLESAQDVMATYAHEVVAHKGMRGLLGEERYNELCERLGAALTPEQKELVEEYAGSDADVLGDEYIARIAEMLIDEKGDIKEPTTWEKVKAVVREFFRDVFGLELTDADIRYMLWRSGERLRRNKADVMTRAQDVVTGEKLSEEAALSKGSSVRFAIGKRQAMDAKSLVVTHGISLRGMRRAMKTGALINPSVAVWDYTNKANYAPSYGAITFVFSPQTIDGQATFTGDIFSPVVPRILRGASRDDLNSVTDALEAAGIPKEIGAYYKFFFDKRANANRSADEAGDTLRSMERTTEGALRLLYAFETRPDEMRQRLEEAKRNIAKPTEGANIDMRYGAGLLHALLDYDSFDEDTFRQWLVDVGYDKYGIKEKVQKEWGSLDVVDATPENISNMMTSQMADEDTYEKVLSIKALHGLKDIKENSEDLRGEKDMYYESKFTRLVRFDEIPAAVIPVDLPHDIRNFLTENGVRIYEYSPEEDNDRERKVREVAKELDLRFRIGQKESTAQNRTAHPQEAIHVSGVSGDALAKVRENLEILTSVYEKRSNSAKGLITDLSRALRLKQRGASNYGSFVLPDGRIVTLRISNHNANVAHFDANGESEGISIVITNRKDRGLQGDGAAHVMEFFYSKRALERAGSKSMVDVIRSICQTLETGVYVDTTGIARVDETNAVRESIAPENDAATERVLSQEQRTDVVKAVAAELQDKFGVEVEVVDSLDGVQNEQARKAIAAGANVKGWYDTKTGKVYIYAPNAESAQDVMATYAHEVVAHKGMRGLLGKKRYDKLCKRLDAALTPEQRELVEEYEGSKADVLGDEYVARIAEMLIDEKGEIKEPTTWEKVKGAVRDFFRDVFGIDLTDADIRYLLWRSGERLRRNKADVMTRAQDVVTGQELRDEATLSHGSPIRFAIGRKRITDFTKREFDKAYFDALERKDMAYARQLVDEAARRAGYTDTESDYQGRGAWTAPGNPGYTDEERRAALEEDTPDINVEDIAKGVNLVDERTFYNPRVWGGKQDAREAIIAIRQAVSALNNGRKPTITIYRAVPTAANDEELSSKKVRENYVRNGDWVTPSKSYAIEHGEHRFGKGRYRIIEQEVEPRHLWWDGNDIREWGFDDGNEYRYQNTRNNRKLNDIVTYDYDGNIIPLSKRFNKREYDTRFSIGEPYDVKENPVGRVEPGLNSKTVVVVSVPRHNFKGSGKEAVAAAKLWAKGEKGIMREYSDEETGGKGRMAVTERALNRYFSDEALKKSKNIGVHLAVATQLPNIIKESADCESHPDFKKVKGERKPENGLASDDIIHRMYAAVELEGKIYRVKLTVREQADKNKTNVAYSYEVVEIELSDGSPYATDAAAVQPLSDAPNNSIPLAKLLKNVRMSYAEAGKEANFLLDESRRRDEKEIEQTTVAETVNAVAAELQDKFGVEVEVVESLAGVQNEKAREALEARKPVKGWYEPSTGKVVIYAPNAESAQDVMATYAHEVVAHKGMRGLLGEERYNELCERLGAALTPEQRELVEEYEGSKDDVLGDEYIARIAEELIDEQGNIKEPTTWEKVKGAVREFFRDVFGLELTDADIRYMLWCSGERLRRNKADAFTRAQDVVTGQKLKDDAARMRQEEADYQREVREITERAKADGTFMKAPNGEPSTLNERQWTHVRTTRFKKWFGDWELRHKVVNIVTGLIDHGFKNFAEARKWAKDNLVRVYSNEETGGKGEIRISGRAVDKFLSESSISKSDNKDVHLAVLKSLPDVLYKSIDAEQHPDRKKGVDGTRDKANGLNSTDIIHRLYGVVEIGGKTYRVKTTVKEIVRQNGEKTVHSYEATEIELLAGQTEKGVPFSRNSNNSISAANLLQGIESANNPGTLLLENHSKVVDENGEPKVVYHGTRSTGFSVFDDSKGAKKWKTGAPAGTSWFSDSRSTARSYSGSSNDAEFWDEEDEYFEPEYPAGIYACFLNIRTPYKEWFYGANWDGSRDDYAVFDGEGNVVEDGFGTREDAEEYAQKEGLEDYSVEEAPDLWDDTNNIARRALDDKQNDGAIIYDVVDGGAFGDPDAANVYVVFESNQIKSATDNVGTYDQNNDDIRFAIGRKRKDDMRKGLLNKLTNATEEQVEQTITEIEKLGEQSKAGGDAKVEKAALHWVKKGTIILPEDGYKVIEAVKMATDKGIDVAQYDSPMRLINENTSWKKRKDMADPDKVATLSGKRALGNTGITIYNVEDSEQGQRDMRMLWNGTWGEERECPWCLLHDDGHGGVSSHAKSYWFNTYTAYPKRVAFKDGRPIAFFAERKENAPHWWDLNDSPHEGIPVEGKIPNDELGRDARMLYNMDGSINDYAFISRGNEENGIYETWWSLDTKRSEGFYENGTPRVYKEWDEEGTLREYDDGLRQYRWDKEGTLLSAHIPERGSAEWHKNGVPASVSVRWSKIRGQIFPIATSRCEWTSEGRLMSSTCDDIGLILGDNKKQIKREDGLKVSLDDNNRIVSVIKEGSRGYRELIPGRYYRDADGHRYYHDENEWRNSYSHDYCSEERQSEIERECSEFLGEAETALPELAAIEERLRVDARMKEVQWADREEVEKEARRSLKSYHIGNSDSMHSTSRATSPVDTGDQSADETSGAKVDKKIKNGKDFLKSIAAFSVEVQRGEVAGKDFVRAFMQYLGYNDHGQSSEYIHFSADNERITLRMSDHRGNARNIIINGVRTDKGYSIVISSEDARDGIKFKNSSWAQVDEYVYKDPSQKQLVDITRGLFNLFDEGEYLDLAGAAEHNVSPRAEKDGQKKDDTLFRTDPSATTVEGKTATRVNSATIKETAADLRDKFGVEVEVVESLDEVQNAKAREAIDKGKPIKGWYEPSTGKVYIYAPNAESAQDVMATYAHEVVAHKGMRGLLGEDKYNELCERLGEALTPEQRELVEEYEGSKADVLGDEYVARIAEMLIDEKGEIKEPTTWEKVKGAVREFFRDVLGLELTDADIRYMLWRSGERLRRNKADVMTRAQDVVTGQKLKDDAARMRQEEADYQREVREITERAKADGTFMKAPNGKPSNLNERQWAHVRTTRFKKWFGDWEKAIIRVFLMGNNYVSRLIGDEFTKDGVPLTEKVPAYYQERYGGVVHRDGLGDVILDRRSVKDSLSHGISRNKSAAFAAVGEIITDGMIIDTQKDWKGRNINSVTIAAPIEIGGKGFVGVVIVTRGSGTNANRFYLHEVILQESLQEESIKTDTKADSHQGDVAKILKEIASASENVSKVVDENGEPKVVYHEPRTTKRFSVFGNRRNFFIDNERVAEMFHGESAYILYIDGEPIEIDRDFSARNIADELWIDDIDNATGFNLLEEIPTERLNDMIADGTIQIGIEDFEGVKEVHLEKAESRTMSVFLNIRNPKQTDFKGATWMSNKGLGYDETKHDGHIVTNIREGGPFAEIDGEDVPPATDYIVSNPSQIKSATDNVGTYDQNNDDIRFAIGRKRKDDMRKGLLNKLTNATEEQVEQTITEIEKLGEQSKAGGGRIPLAGDRKGRPYNGARTVARARMFAGTIVCARMFAWHGRGDPCGRPHNGETCARRRGISIGRATTRVASTHTIRYRPRKVYRNFAVVNRKRKAHEKL